MNANDEPKDKKPYTPPAITLELDLEAKAGSPLPCPDDLITGNPCP